MKMLNHYRHHLKAPSDMQALSPPKVVERLNKHVRSPQAKLSFFDTVSFGEALTLNRYGLGNGLSILLLSDHSAPVLSYHTWFRVGSRHDRAHKTGLAHLFEHLMFNQTKNLETGMFDRILEAKGGESNAATWVDWTYYYANLPSSELQLIIGMEADRMANLVLREPQVASEKEVVANERAYRVEDDIEGSVAEQMSSMAFRRHPYGQPTIGWMEDIQGFTITDCERFYRTYYAPNNAIVVAVGDLDQEQALSAIQDQYGPLKSARIPVPKKIVEPRQRGERRLVLRRPTPSQRLSVGYHCPAFGSRDYLVLSLANEILFGGRSSRLYRRMVREQEICVELRGSLSPFSDPGLYEIWMVVRQGYTAKYALEIWDAEIEKLAQKLVPQKELQKVKNLIDLAFLQGMETASGKAERIGFYETVLGDAAQIFARREMIKGINRQELRQVVKRYIQGKRRTVITVIPSKDKKS